MSASPSVDVHDGMPANSRAQTRLAIAALGHRIHMARPERDPTGPTLDDEGIPDLDGPLPEKAATGDPQEGASPPADRPNSLDWGTTPREQRLGEPISVRVARERPDLGEEGALDPPVDEGIQIVDPARTDLPDDEDLAP
jgi:hypothetical protein